MNEGVGGAISLPRLSAETSYQDREEDDEHVHHHLQYSAAHHDIDYEENGGEAISSTTQPLQAYKTSCEKWLLVVESPIMFAAFPSETFKSSRARYSITPHTKHQQIHCKYAATIREEEAEDHEERRGNEASERAVGDRGLVHWAARMSQQLTMRAAPLCVAHSV